MKVVVTGASGYIGKAILSSLTGSHYDVIALARHRSSSQSNAVMWEEKDVFSPDLARTFTGADAVVHLIGIIREVPAEGITFQRMHVEASHHVLAAMQEAHVSRLIHISALGTRPHAHSQYHRTKWDAEQVVHSHDELVSTIIRPSLVFGDGSPFFAMLRQLAALPAVPVPGDGTTLFQPVYRGDLAALIAALVSDSSAGGLTLEVGGPEQFTLNDLYNIMGDQIHRRHPPKMHIPMGVMSTLAHLSRILPVPITSDQLAMLTEPNITSDTRWLKWVSSPHSLVAAGDKV